MTEGVFACANINEWCYCPTHNRAYYGSPKSGCCKDGRYMEEVEEKIFKLGREDGYDSALADDKLRFNDEVKK